MSEKNNIFPVSTIISKEFWESIKQHKFIIQKCKKCSKYIFYPREFCPYCLSSNLKWVQATEYGTIHTYSIIYRPPFSAFKENIPYNIAIIELDEGVRLMGTIINCNNNEIKIGRKVKIVFKDIYQEYSIPYFILYNE